MALPERPIEHSQKPPIPERFASFHFNPEFYKSKVEEIISTQGLAASEEVRGIDSDHYQHWGGSLEDIRLELQNKMNGGFGWQHWIFHEREGRQFHPKKIAVVGVGKDATILENILEAYGEDTQIEVYEMKIEQILGADKTLRREMPDVSLDGDNPRVRFIFGNATEELRNHQGEYDLVEAQLLLQHLEDRPGQEKTALKSMVQSMQGALSDGGRLIVSDLMMSAWWAEEISGYEKDPEAEKDKGNINTGIYGKDGIFRGMLPLGWLQRGAHPWETKEELSGKVLEYADQLQLVQIHEAVFGVSDELRAVMDLMPSTVFTARINALKQAKEEYIASQDETIKQVTAKKMAVLSNPSVDELWKWAQIFHEASYGGKARARMPNLDFFIFEKP